MSQREPNLTAGQRPQSRRVPLWFDAGLAVAFGIFFAYDLWEVVESTVQLLSYGLQFTAFGWVVLAAAMLAPLVAFGVAFMLGRGRGVLAKIALYLSGLAVSAALFLSFSVLLGASSSVVVPS